MCFKTKHVWLWLSVIVLSLLQFIFIVLTYSVPYDNAFSYYNTSSIYTFIPLHVLIILIDVYCFIRTLSSGKKNNLSIIAIGPPPLTFKMLIRAFAFISFATSVLTIFLFETLLIHMNDPNTSMSKSIYFIIITFIVIMTERHLFTALSIKGIFFSPFLAHEYFELFFEHLYVELNHLNEPIMPQNKSPLRKKNPQRQNDNAESLKAKITG